MLTTQPFEDVEKLISDQAEVPVSAPCSVSKTLENNNFSTETGLGRLYTWLSSCQQTSEPSIRESHICVFASSYDSALDNRVVGNFIKGASVGAEPVNRLCVDHGVGLRVLEMAPDYPHARDQEWSELDCTKSVAFGMEAAAAGGHVLGVSAVAPGNLSGLLSLISIAASRLDGKAAPDGGCAEHINAQDLALVEAAKAENMSPLHCLRLFGGREVAGCVGAFLAARSRGLAVVIDGWAALAAYAILKAQSRDVVPHVMLAATENRLQMNASQLVGLTPLIAAEVETGPGCGVALGLSVLKGAVDIFANN